MSALIKTLARTTGSVDLRRSGAFFSKCVTASVETRVTTRGWIFPSITRPSRRQRSRTMAGLVVRCVSQMSRNSSSSVITAEGASPVMMTFLLRRSLSVSSVWTARRTDCSIDFVAADGRADIDESLATAGPNLKADCSSTTAALSSATSSARHAWPDWRFWMRTRDCRRHF